MTVQNANFANRNWECLSKTSNCLGHWDFEWLLTPRNSRGFAFYQKYGANAQSTQVIRIWLLVRLNRRSVSFKFIFLNLSKIPGFWRADRRTHRKSNTRIKVIDSITEWQNLNWYATEPHITYLWIVFLISEKYISSPSTNRQVFFCSCGLQNTSYKFRTYCSRWSRFQQVEMNEIQWTCKTFVCRIHSHT